ncbi:hypothetical protein P5V15_005524 [Pogonomyrmex californicus]
MIITKSAMIVENQSMPMESILTRDQRTTSHRVHDYATQIYAPASKSAVSSLHQTKYQNDVVVRHFCIKATTAKTEKLGHAQKHLPYDLHLMPTFYHDRRARSNSSFNLLKSLRLSSILVILLALSAKSSPVNAIDFPVMDFKNVEMKWINPCGLSTKLRNGSNPDIAQLNDHDLVNQIVIQASNALKHAEKFRDDFVSNKTFFATLHCRSLSAVYLLPIYIAAI